MTFRPGDAVWLIDQKIHGKVYALPSLLRQAYVVRRNDGILCGVPSEAMRLARPVRAEDAATYFGGQRS